MGRKRSDVTEICWKLKHNYLASDEAHGAKGGGKPERYLAIVDQWATDNRDEAMKLLHGFMRKTAQVVWHTKAPLLVEHKQIKIKGFDIPQELVYFENIDDEDEEDNDEESQHERYAHIYIDNGATLAHLEMDYQITRRNSDHQNRIAAQKLDALVAARRAARGNQAALLIDIADEVRNLKSEEPETVE